jgi:RecA/RadA recombinase
VPKNSSQEKESFDSFIADLGKAVEDNKEFTRTGCLMLDLLCGGGQGLGIKQGSFVAIAADPSVGKSFLAQEIIACAYWSNPDSCLFNYDDTECGNTFDQKTMYGIDIRDKSTYRSDTIEKCDTHIKLFIDEIEKKKNKYTHGIYVLDSLTQLTSEASLDRQSKRVNKHLSGKTLDTGSYEMDKQKFLSQHLFPDNRQRAADNNVTIIIIDQFRENIGALPFQNRKVIPGGKAKEYAISTRLILKTKSKIKKRIDGEEYVVGYCVEASLQKARTPRPERKCTYVFYTDYGIHDVQSSLEYLYDLRDDKGKLKSGANCLVWDSSEKDKEKTKENVLEWVERHNLLDRIKDDKMGAWRYNLSYIEEWVFTRGDDTQQEDWKNTFGESYALDALCALIDANPEMKEELDRRVFNKWEGIEAKCKTTMQPKYANKYK